MNKGDLIVHEILIAMNENAVHTMAAKRRDFMEYLTVIP